MYVFLPHMHLVHLVCMWCCTRGLQLSNGYARMAEETCLDGKIALLIWSEGAGADSWCCKGWRVRVGVRPVCMTALGVRSVWDACVSVDVQGVIGHVRWGECCAGSHRSYRMTLDTDAFRYKL